MPDTKTKTINIWADTKSMATCRGKTCHARIEWAEVVASGRKMCFDAPVVALETFHDPGSRRMIETVDLSTNHWASCADAKDFSKKR